MNHVDLDQIPEMGGFHKERIEGTNPPCYRPVRNPVHALYDPVGVVDCYGELWLVGKVNGKLWKVRS